MSESLKKLCADAVYNLVFREKHNILTKKLNADVSNAIASALFSWKDWWPDIPQNFMDYLCPTDLTVQRRAVESVDWELKSVLDNKFNQNNEGNWTNMTIRGAFVTTLHKIPQDLCLMINTRLPFLRYLKIENCEWLGTDFNTVWTALARIFVLRISNPGNAQISLLNISRLRHIQCLELVDCSIEDDDTVIELYNLPHLQMLNISGERRIVSLPALYAACRKQNFTLKSFDCSSSTITEDEVISVIRFHPNLKEITLIQLPNVNKERITSLRSSLNVISDNTVTNCYNLLKKYNESNQYGKIAQLIESLAQLYSNNPINEVLEMNLAAVFQLMQIIVDKFVYCKVIYEAGLDFLLSLTVNDGANRFVQNTNGMIIRAIIYLSNRVSKYYGHYPNAYIALRAYAFSEASNPLLEQIGTFLARCWRNYTNDGRRRSLVGYVECRWLVAEFSLKLPQDLIEQFLVADVRLRHVRLCRYRDDTGPCVCDGQAVSDEVQCILDMFDCMRTKKRAPLISTMSKLMYFLPFCEHEPRRQVHILTGLLRLANFVKKTFVKTMMNGEFGEGFWNFYDRFLRSEPIPMVQSALLTLHFSLINIGLNRWEETNTFTPFWNALMEYLRQNHENFIRANPDREARSSKQYQFWIVDFANFVDQGDYDMKRIERRTSKRKLKND